MNSKYWEGQFGGYLVHNELAASHTAIIAILIGDVAC